MAIRRTSCAKPRQGERIYVITTGGTSIEMEYPEPAGSVASFDGKIDGQLGLLRLSSDVRLVPLLDKGNSEITDSDRELLLGTVKALLPESTPIIITHGAEGHDWGGTAGWGDLSGQARKSCSQGGSSRLQEGSEDQSESHCKKPARARSVARGGSPTGTRDQ